MIFFDNRFYDIKITQNQIQDDFFYGIFKLREYFKLVLISEIKEKSLQNKFTLNLIDNISDETNYFIKNKYLAFTLVHEFKVAKKAKIIDDSNHSLNDFILLTCENEWIEYFFDKYPKIESTLHKFIHNIINYIIDITLEVKSNLNEINKIFLDEGKISNSFIFESFMLFQGDLHNNNKTVSKISISDKSTSTIINLYYKPRLCQNEKTLIDVISFVKSQKIKIDLEFPKFLEMEKGSLHEEILPHHVSDENEIKDYYENFGKVLCLFYMMGSTDIIPDNIIVRKNKIYLIDYENICDLDIRSYYSDSFQSSLEDSVMNSGILPVWMVNNNMKKDILLSSLFNLANQKTELKTWDITGDKVVEKEKSINFDSKPDKHLPYYNNEPIRMNSYYLDFFLKGFDYFYKSINSKSKNIISFFENNKEIKFQNRLLIHPTSIYSLLRRELSVPEYILDDEKLKELVDSLIEVDSFDNYELDREKLKNSVFEQLYSLDIPIFYLNNDGKIVDGNEKVISQTKGNFEYLINRIINKVRKFSDDDLRLQKEIIKTSIYDAIDYFEGHDKSSKNFPVISFESSSLQNKIINKDKLLNSSIIIGEKILADSFIINNQMNWISLARDEKFNTYYTSFLNNDLYDGITGIAVFYATLYKYTKNIKYLDSCLNIYDQLHILTLRRLESGFYSDLSTKDKTPLSPFAFPGSYLYLGVFLDNNVGQKVTDISLFNKIIKLIINIAEDNKNYDYLLGISGLLDFVLNVPESYFYNKMGIINSLYKLLITKKTDIGENMCAWGMEGLIYDKKDPVFLGGFSHGVSGISYTLFKLSEYERFKSKSNAKRTAIKALNYDRSLFSNEKKGWLDERDKSNDSCAWCHGSAGIGLSRLLTSQYYCDNKMLQELDLSIKNSSSLIGANYSICHGDSGNLEIINAITKSNFQIKNKADYINSINEYLLNLTSLIDNKKNLRCGWNSSLTTPNLFIGYSGIGYQLLRFFDWENTPSVLALEIDKSNNRLLH